MHPGFKDQYSENFKRSTMFKQDALRQLPYPSGQMSQVPRTRLTWLTWHLPKKVSPTHQLTSNQSLNTCNGGAQFIHGRFSTGHDLRLQSGEVTTLGPWERLHQNGNKLLKTVIYQIFVGSWVRSTIVSESLQTTRNLHWFTRLDDHPARVKTLEAFLLSFWSLLYLVHSYGE